MCLEAIKGVIDKHSDCVGCCGKGLAYLKHLTKGINESEYCVGSKKYEKFLTIRNRNRDFESELFREK